MFKAIVPIFLLFLVAQRAQCAIRLLDSDFGYGLYPSDFFGFGLRPLINFPRFRLCPFESSMKEGAVENSIHIGKEGFQASLDVRGFEPNEITVKTVDNKIVIEAKHEEKEDDHGLISRHFIRRYDLPKGYDPNQVVSTLSSDRVLTVKAPAPLESDTKPVERVVQIQQTGPAVNNIKDNSSNSIPVEKLQSQKDTKDNVVES